MADVDNETKTFFSLSHRAIIKLDVEHVIESSVDEIYLW